MKYLFIFLLLSTTLYAARSVKANRQVINATYTTTTVTSATFPDNYQGFYFAVKVTNVSGTAETFDISIEHSFDDADYYPLLSFPQIAAASNLLISVDSNIMKFIKYTVTVAGSSPTADIELNIIYDNIKRND